MINEPAREEILRWQERLENRDFQRRLFRFQEHICQIFEDLRRRTGLRLIRTIIKRDEIKSLDSIVAKIRRLRQQQEQGSVPANFDDINDLAGIKILCPYKSSIDIVVDYLYSQVDKHFRVNERSKADALHKYPYGYEAYHFSAYPIIGAPPGWTPLYCEIQIKTMIQEAWDSQTHDLTYKQGPRIPHSLHGLFTTLANFLTNSDTLGEDIKAQVEELFKEAENQKAVVTYATLCYSMNVLLEMADNYPDMPKATLQEVREALTSPHQPRKFRHLTATESAQINEALRRECAAGRLDQDKCQAAVFVALCQEDPVERLAYTDPEQVAFALQLINALADRGPDDAQGEMMRAGVYWALSRFPRAVEHAERGYYKSERSQLPDEEKARIWADLCYFTADARVFDYFIPSETIELVRDLAHELEKLSHRRNRKKHPDWPATADTLGLVKISLGMNEDEVKQGIALVREAQKLARQQNSWYIKNVAEAFFQRHLSLGEQKLRNLRRS